MALATKNVLGTELAVTDYAGAAQAVLGMARSAKTSGRAYAVAAANTHVVTLARHDPEYREVLAKFSLIVPDGMPLVWVMNRQGAGLEDRVYGPQLMLETFAASEQAPDVSHFLLGSTPGILGELEARMREDYPAANIAGTYSPPFSATGEWPEDEQARIRELIRDSGASVIWVGLGCPKQERWIASQIDRLPAGVYLGIGAAFAMHAGQLKQAPGVVQKCGMEWLWRMLMEPRRLMKRYLKWNSLFLWYLASDRISGRGASRA